MSDDGWGSYPTDLVPLAPEAGPFADRPFLQTVWRYRTNDRSELLIERTPQGAVAIAVLDGTVEFAGQENLTDYHSPLGTEGVDAVVKAVRGLSGHSFSLDSMPQGLAAAVAAGLEQAGVANVQLQRHETVSVLSLPSSYDDWLASIGKKERHEVRRKRRRFESEFGEIVIVRRGIEALEGFSAMHRASEGVKGTFMNLHMEDYFGDLMKHANAIIHTLECDGIPRASAFGFETDVAYFYYNSAFDMDATMASPGIVLLAALIEVQIDRGVPTFDFLKGGERYKVKHGAVHAPLFRVEGRVS